MKRAGSEYVPKFATETPYLSGGTLASMCARVPDFDVEPHVLRTTFALIVMLALVASAAATPSKPTPRLTFPVVGSATYTDDFGDPRAGGPHQGIDIMAARRSPAVAAEAGTIELWTTSVQAGCMLYLRGRSGTTYLYIHLNNDLTGRNDNRGKCVAGTAYAPGLKSGERVAAGELVGFVGDSGDANGIHPHLHFEMHPNDGAAVDPYAFLQKAQPLLFYAKQGTTVSISLTGTIVSSLGGVLELKASEVQLSSAKPVAIRRTLALSVAPDAVVTSLLPGGLNSLAALQRGLPAKVYTSPLRATLAAARGDDNVLSAAQIVIGG
jgi:Peptidase family M23